MIFELNGDRRRIRVPERHGGTGSMLSACVAVGVPCRVCCNTADAAMKVATDAVRLFGAAGISNDAPVNRDFRDAKVLRIVEGNGQIQRNIIARRLVRDSREG